MPGQKNGADERMGGIWARRREISAFRTVGEDLLDMLGGGGVTESFARKGNSYAARVRGVPRSSPIELAYRALGMCESLVKSGGCEQAGRGRGWRANDEYQIPPSFGPVCQHFPKSSAAPIRTSALPQIHNPSARNKSRFPTERLVPLRAFTHLGISARGHCTLCRIRVRALRGTFPRRE
ncbi:hypothetical protein KM043_003697 [Ampulex compressa]|nr:hypothetical protein KM043_003697 [Ampulex compressa]